MTLAQLTEASQVSLPTLRRAMKDLADSRWVDLTGESHTTGGRPAALYGLDDSSYLIISVHFQLPGMRLGAVTLANHVIDDRCVSEHSLLQPADAISEVMSYIQECHERYPERPILGIGVATPGFTDPVSGEILAIGREAAWQNFPLKRRLETSLGLPVIVRNDVDCMAMTELQHGGYSLDQDLAYLGFDEAFKISMFIGAKCYRGPFGNAGNIGRSVVHISRDRDVVPYQVQNIASARAVCTLFHKRVAEDDNPSPLHVTIQSADNCHEQFQLILTAAEAGDALCSELVADMIDILAVSIANLIHIVQPRVLIVGGVLGTMPAGLYAQLEDSIRKFLPSLINNYLILQRSRVSSPNLALAGVAYEFLEQCISAGNFYQMTGEKMDGQKNYC